MKFIIYFSAFISLLFLQSCLSDSDKQHICDCEYDDETEQIIKGVSNFTDIELGMKCDRECGFKRLLIFFYDDSDASKKIINTIASNKILVGDINDNFAFVCLSTEDSTENFKFQEKKFGTNTQPFFAVMNTRKDSLITSFGYLEKAEEIDSKLMKTLYNKD